MSAPTLYFSVDAAVELGKQLGYPSGWTRRGFRQMLLKAQRPPGNPFHGGTSFFSKNLVVLGNRLELYSLQAAMESPEFDRAVLALPGIRVKTLSAIRAITPELHKYLTTQADTAGE